MEKEQGFIIFFLNRKEDLNVLNFWREKADCFRMFALEINTFFFLGLLKFFSFKVESFPFFKTAYFSVFYRVFLFYIERARKAYKRGSLGSGKVFVGIFRECFISF